MECALLLGDRAVGTVRWRREGALWAVDAACAMEPGYIYRLELYFPSGRRTLGVMLPENGRFRLRKSLSAPDEPRSARVLRARPGEEPLPVLGFPFSRLASWETAALVRDDLFLRLCPDRVAAAEEERLRWLALPLEWGGETALAPFLCLCAAAEAEGRSWALLCADGEGALRLPPGCDKLCGSPAL